MGAHVMSQPEPTGSRYGRYVGVLGVLIAVLFVINTTLSNSHGVGGIAPGHRLAPFAVPLALGAVNGDANVATHADDGEAGKRPACSVRGAGDPERLRALRTGAGGAGAVRRRGLLPADPERDAGARALLPGRAFRRGGAGGAAG